MGGGANHHEAELCYHDQDNEPSIISQRWLQQAQRRLAKSTDGEFDGLTFDTGMAFSHDFRKHLHKVLSKPGPFCDEDWVPGPETIDALETSKIL